MGLLRNDAEVTNADLDCSPQNDYASEETVAKVDDVVEPGEKVHFLARETGGGVDVEVASDGTSLFGDEKTRLLGTMGDVRTVATDERLLVKIPKAFGSDVRSVDYDEILAVGVDTEGLYRRLSVRTDETAYHVDVGELSPGACREMAAFVRERSPQVADAESSGTTEPSGDDTERTSVREDGAEIASASDADPGTDPSGDADLDHDRDRDHDGDAGPDMLH